MKFTDHEFVTAFGDGKKLHREDWPEGAYIRLDYAFSNDASLQEWCNQERDRKCVVYFDGVETVSPNVKHALIKFIGTPELNWTILS